MPSTYTLTDGRTRTTCGQHRTLGYAHVGGTWVCRGCSAPISEHESTDETVARRAREAVTV